MATQAIISAPWLDKVVINSGHQHLRVGPDRQPSLVPPDEKAAVRRICVATRSKTLSAGHMVVCFVTGQMVGDRRFPGATILGARSCTPSANHPVSVPPTGPELPDASFLWTVYEMAGCLHPDGFTFRFAVYDDAASLWPAVAAAAKRPAPRGGCWSAVSGEQEAEGR